MQDITAVEIMDIQAGVGGAAGDGQTQARAGHVLDGAGGTVDDVVRIHSPISGPADGDGETELPALRVVFQRRGQVRTDKCGGEVIPEKFRCAFRRGHPGLVTLSAYPLQAAVEPADRSLESTSKSDGQTAGHPEVSRDVGVRIEIQDSHPLPLDAVRPAAGRQSRTVCLTVLCPGHAGCPSAPVTEHGELLVVLREVVIRHEGKGTSALTPDIPQVIADSDIGQPGLLCVGELAGHGLQGVLEFPLGPQHIAEIILVAVGLGLYAGLDVVPSGHGLLALLHGTLTVLEIVGGLREVGGFQAVEQIRGGSIELPVIAELPCIGGIGQRRGIEPHPLRVQRGLARTHRDETVTARTAATVVNAQAAELAGKVRSRIVRLDIVHTVPLAAHPHQE